MVVADALEAHRYQGTSNHQADWIMTSIPIISNHRVDWIMTDIPTIGNHQFD